MSARRVSGFFPPPTVRSVSATLRTAGFAAWKPGRDEGYLCEWFGTPDASPVRVSFKAITRELDDLAMKTMTAALMRKGWSVREVSTGGGALIVTALAATPRVPRHPDPGRLNR